MKRFAFSVLALLTLSSLAGANGTCAARRGLVPQQSFFRAPAYGYSQGCYGGYGVQQQTAPVPAVCDTCQPQQQQQFDVAPMCGQQQALYAPQASFAPSYGYGVQRSFASSYGVGAAFAPSYAVGAAFAPGYSVYVGRQRFFAPRFLGPPIHRFPGRFPRTFGVGAGVGAGFVPGFGLGGFGGSGFFFRNRNTAFGFGRF